MLAVVVEKIYREAMPAPLVVGVRLLVVGVPLAEALSTAAPRVDILRPRDSSFRPEL